MGRVMPNTIESPLSACMSVEMANLNRQGLRRVASTAALLLLP
jgi:hypothetical protein